MISPGYDFLAGVLAARGLVFFTDPYDLNLIGIRSNTRTPDRFDDTFVVVYRDADGNRRSVAIPITTDPGLSGLVNPSNPKGTAILAPGQWRGMWNIGMHRGKYRALVQVSPVTVLRDANRDSTLDWDGKPDTGLFGINFHYADPNNIRKYIGPYSLGCQVCPVKADHDYVMALVALQGKYLGSTKVSYTLLLESWL